MKRRELMGVLMASTAWGQKKIDDGAIYDQVKLRLANDADVKGGDLQVDVKEGAVVVRGRVATDRAKAKIEKLVKKVKGVKSVENQVRVEAL